MALFVYDHGYRIQTPKESLFQPGGVNSLNRSRHSHRSADTEDRLHADGEKFVIPGPNSQAQQNTNTDSVSKAYTSLAEESSAETEAPKLTVSSVMVSPVHTINPTTPVSAAWKRMHSLEVSHLIVTEDDRPLGLLSKVDLLEAGSDSITPIKEIYSKQLIAATPETLIQDVAISFIENEINSMPVVDKEDKVVGIICRTDLLRLLVSGAHLESWV
ncbi:HPP family protein [Pseudoalteromonas sp.]|uniref:CBS domain-containing protein n=1 Tax=Pseudoalteromonas sp. TaxID=53249 RepID=UPI00260803BB|nr:CBS domain-containing protein [Pseudoalteromonas sp.]MCP4588772.1 CBS domain-containing protein [Pseudoalteromonas sp.]